MGHDPVRIEFLLRGVLADGEPSYGWKAVSTSPGGSSQNSMIAGCHDDHDASR
jgi:hypothetical protein